MENTLKKIKPIQIFIILYSAGAIFNIFLSSVYIIEMYKYIDVQRIILKILYAAGILFNICIYKTYTYKKFLTHFFISILILITAGISNTFYKISYLWFFLLAIPPVSLKQISKTVLAVTTLSVAAIIIITISGGGENIAFLRPGTNFMRYSYGFLNPNLFAAYLFQICIALACLKWNTWNSKDNIFTFSVLCLTFFFTNSRTTSILILLLLLIINLRPLLNRRLISLTAQILLLILPFFSMITSKLYCMSNTYAYFLDEIFSYRFRNACYCLASYPISFFGNNIKITGDLLLIDNIYANLLIHYGICFSILIFTGCCLMIKKAYEKNNMVPVIILILSMLQGITESIPLIYYLNFSILTFSAMLNNSKLFEKA